jgi:hypothetical protein
VAKSAPLSPPTATTRLAEHLMSAGGVTGLRASANHEPSWWLRRELAAIDRAAINGRLGSCRHARRSRVTVVALWDPGTLWCLPCGSSALTLDGEADRQCDRCLEVVDRITAITVVSRNTMVMFGLCPPCRIREEGRR